MFNLQWYWTC